ncbi:MAG: hypothetical protein ACLPX8_02760 [Bryobacteraceae bacterium]|jgi:hypothetical protein
MSPDNILWHQSGINQKGEPFVQLLRGTEIVCQMDTEQARQHAHAILEAAEAAEEDSFIFDWVLNHVGSGKEQAMGLIIDFRKYRAERTGKSQGPTKPTDWVMP